jgi:hypothetical protein
MKDNEIICAAPELNRLHRQYVRYFNGMFVSCLYLRAISDSSYKLNARNGKKQGSHE